jgi:hypothetical protein
MKSGTVGTRTQEMALVAKSSTKNLKIYTYANTNTNTSTHNEFRDYSETHTKNISKKL